MSRFVLELLLAAAVLTAPATGWACRWPDLGIEAGVGGERTALGDTRPVAVWAVGAGWALEPCLDWPLRAEVSLGSSTRGPPWYQGVQAVRVRSLQLDLTAAAGPSLPFWRNFSGSVELGGEVLVGPGFRLTAITTEVQGRSATHLEPAPTARGVGGLFLRVGKVRFTLRGEYLAPEDGQGLVGVAWVL